MLLGLNLAVTTRMRCGLKKLKMTRQVYSACVRSGLTFGSKTQALKVEHDKKLNRAEMRVIR